MQDRARSRSIHKSALWDSPLGQSSHDEQTSQQRLPYRSVSQRQNCRASFGEMSTWKMEDEAERSATAREAEELVDDCRRAERRHLGREMSCWRTGRRVVGSSCHPETRRQNRTHQNCCFASSGTESRRHLPPLGLHLHLLLPRRLARSRESLGNYLVQDR